MNLRDLHYLVTVADSGQFARAAKICNVSQPSLSMQLKKLEEELGVTIFERGGRQLIITQAGRAIIERARQALQEVTEMRNLANLFAGKGMEFRLGIIPTVAPYLLPHYVPRIREALPTLKLHLVEAQTQQLEIMLAKGVLDGIIVALPIDSGTFKTALLYTEQCFIAAPKNHRLARRKKLNSHDLASERILLLDEGHCLRNQALSLCSKTGMEENTNFRATSLETLRYMVASGEGITIMPESAIKKDDGIVYIPCTESGFNRKIGIAWRSSTPHASLIETLKKLGSAIKFNDT